MASGRKIFTLAFAVSLVTIFGIRLFGVYAKFKKELNQANNLNMALQRANQSVGSNFKNATDTLEKTLSELKAAREQLEEIETNQVNPLKEKLDELKRINQEKDGSLNQLKDEFAQLNNRHNQWLTQAKLQQQKIQYLINEKVSLQEKITNLRNELVLENPFIKNIESSPARQDQPGLLDSEADKRNISRITLMNQLAHHQKLIDELNCAKQDLQGQVKQLKMSLSARNADLDKRSLESRKLKREIYELQSKIDELEKQLFESHIALVNKNATIDLLGVQQDSGLNEWEAGRKAQEKARQLEKQKSELLARIDQFKEESIRKNKPIVSLKKEIEELRLELAKKEDALAQEKTLKSSLSEDLAKQKSYAQEIDSLNTQLKNKLSELSNILAQKQAELTQGNSKIIFLQKESSSLESRLVELERELSHLKQAQVNISVTDAKEKAESLKLKIENILQVAR